MAYIGAEPQIGNYQICDAISVVNGQAAYTMQVDSTNVVPESVNHMIVSLNGVIQKPGSSFTISSSTITFASNLATGDSIDFIILLGNVLDLGVPSDNTVTTAKLGADAVTGAKIADDAIDSEHYTDGSIDTAHIADANVTTAKIADTAITTAKIAADAITEAKIADDAISDEHLDPTAITGQTAETSVANDDLVLVSDTSASAALRKMTVANLVANAGGGKVLQVVGGTIGGTNMANTTGYVGAGLSITPSATSSKILVIMGGRAERYSGNSGTYSSVQLHRGTSNLYTINDAILYQITSGARVMFNVNYLDSPNTTSSTQYRIYHTVESGTPSVSYYQHWSLLEIDGS